MIASPPSVRPGHVRGGLSTETLRRVLQGEHAFEDALTGGGNKPPQFAHYSHIAPGILLGFVLHPEQPREIVVVRLPFIGQTVPAITLLPAADDWEPVPQLVSKDYLLRHEAVVLRADWLNHLLNVAGTLEQPSTRVFGVDRTLLAIGGVWERWERIGMTWPQRCKDLARLTGLREPKPNTLLNKCKRLGLVHGDNKARSASAT